MYTRKTGKIRRYIKEKKKTKEKKKKEEKTFPVFTINLVVIRFMKADRPEHI